MKYSMQCADTKEKEIKRGIALMSFSGLRHLSRVKDCLQVQQASGPGTSIAAIRSYFYSGVAVVTVSGWLYAHPLPKAPNLPVASQCYARGMDGQRRIQVWVDPRTGSFYYPGNASYGRTPDGWFTEISVAQKQGFRPASGQ
jgi:hypothetical protein